MSFLTSRRWAFQETCKGLWQDKGLFALATLLSALAISIPLFISSLFYEIADPMRQLPTAVEITIFTEQRAKAVTIADAVAKVPVIEQVRIISKDEAFRSLNDQLGLKNKTDARNPLPDLIIATANSNASPDAVGKAAAEIEKLSGVDMIAYETAWQEKFRAVSKAAQTGIIALGAIVLLLVIMVLAAAIRMMTFSALPQMRALYFFGASPSFAVRPWAWRGFILLCAASLGALGITSLCVQLLSPALADIAELYGITLMLSLPPADWCFGFVIICSLVGYIVAALAAQDSWRRAQR